MAVDAALGRPNPWRDVFSVDRETLRGGAWDFIKENKDYPYYLVRDWLAPTEGDSLKDVGRNQHLRDNRCSEHFSGATLNRRITI